MIMWFILSAFLFALVSGLIGVARMETPNVNVSATNYTDTAATSGSVLNLIGDITTSWWNMLTLLPGWMAIIIMASLAALILYAKATIWTGIGG